MRKDDVRGKRKRASARDALSEAVRAAETAIADAAAKGAGAHLPLGSRRLRARLAQALGLDDAPDG